MCRNDDRGREPVSAGLISLADIAAARERLRGVALLTPVVSCGDDLSIKAESLQPIGSFKLRGAYNLIAQIPPSDRAARSHHLLQRQSRPGRCLLCARPGNSRRHRDARDAPAIKVDGHSRARRRNCHRRPGQRRAPRTRRGSCPQSRLHHRPALRSSPHHCWPGHLRRGNSRATACCRPRARAGWRRRITQWRCGCHQTRPQPEIRVVGS